MFVVVIIVVNDSFQGRIQDFKLGGGVLKQIAPRGISCEKSRFYAKKSYFSNFRGDARKFWGISCEKSRFYAKKIIFFRPPGFGEITLPVEGPSWS